MSERQPIIGLTATGVSIGEYDQVSPGLKAHFLERNWLKLPGFLSGSLLDRVMSEIDRGEFYHRIHPGVGENRELCLKENIASKLLELLLNGSELHRCICDLTDCGEIGSFVGRVYRFEAGQRGKDAWHSDNIDSRVLSLSINLSENIYSGGVLQLRQEGVVGVCETIVNSRLGDAVLFRIEQGLQHRVTAVTGTSPRTAYAGWFCSQPSFRDRLD